MCINLYKMIDIYNTIYDYINYEKYYYNLLDRINYKCINEIVDINLCKQWVRDHSIMRGKFPTFYYSTNVIVFKLTEAETCIWLKQLVERCEIACPSPES